MKLASLLFISMGLAAGALAQPVLDQVIPITTASEEARTLFLQGRDQLENIDYAAAARHFDRAIEKDPGFALAFLYRSLAGGSAQTAEENMEKAQALSANASEGERLLVAFYKASNEARGAAALQSMDKLLALYPDDKRLKTYAGFYFQTHSDNAKAIELYQQALQIDKEYAPAYNYLGYANMAVGDYPAAEKAFLEYIRLMPHLPNPYDSYAEFLLKRGRYDESIVQYQKAYDTDNQFTGSLSGIGNNYLFMGEYDKARNYYERYFSESPRISDKLIALRLQARSYLYQDKVDEAMAAYARHQAFAEKEKESAILITTAFNEGFVLSEMGRPVEGLRQCTEAAAMIDRSELAIHARENLQINGTYWLTLVNAANRLFDKAQVSLADYVAAIRLRNNPDESISLHALLGYLAFQDKRWDGAIAQLQRLENDPWALFYRARCLQKKGDQQGARLLFDRVVHWNQESLNLAVVWSRARKALCN